MRAALIGLALAAFSLAGCGDDSKPSSDPAKALEYMPAEPAFLAILDTDVDGEQVQGFEDTIGNGNAAGDVEKLLERLLSEDPESPISYDEDVKPLLGGPLVAAVDPDSVTASFEDVVVALIVADEDKARETIEKIPDADQIAVVEDGVLIAAPTPQALSRARGRKDAGEGLDPAEFEAAHRGLPEDALLKLYADVDGGILELPELEDLKAEPWIDSIRSFGGAISFDGSEMRGDALLATEGASPQDLPLAPGTDQVPEIVRREGWISGANIDQSRTTAFLLRTVRAAFPESQFVRDVEKVERERDIDFEREFLRQFNGPSQSLLNPDGTFAARSAVSDPEALAKTVRKIAPDLGRLVEDLQGLRTGGLASLLLFAPDAPAAPSVLDSATVTVESLGNDMYRMSGLVGPGPDEIVFGLVGEVFVVAEDEAAAREIAEAPTEAFEGPPGAAVLSASGVAIEEAATDLLGIDGAGGRLARAITGSLSADENGLRGRLIAEFAD